MKKKKLHQTYDHVRTELNREKKIALLQILAIIVLIILSVLLAIFSDDDAFIPTWIRSLF